MTCRTCWKRMMNRKGMLAAAGVGLGSAVLVDAYLKGRHPVGNRNVPEPAKPVDLQRYVGRWFELARYEQRYEKGCDGVTADYSMRPDGSIDVVNRCRKPDGRIDEARGRAKVVETDRNAKLRVSFFGPFYGNYWILDHADDYSWSIVGEPSGRYLWILARSATPSEAKVAELIKIVEQMGYDSTMLVRTKQP